MEKTDNQNTRLTLDDLTEEELDFLLNYKMLPKRRKTELIEYMEMILNKPTGDNAPHTTT